MPLPFILGALAGGAIGFLVGSAIGALFDAVIDWFSSGYDELTDRKAEKTGRIVANALDSGNFETHDIGLGSNELGALTVSRNKVIVTHYNYDDGSYVKGTEYDDPEFVEEVRKSKVVILT